MKIVMVGTGYVGQSNAALPAQHHEVVTLDIVPEKVVAMLNRKPSLVAKVLEDYLKHKQLNLRATTHTGSVEAVAQDVILLCPHLKPP